MNNKYKSLLKDITIFAIGNMGSKLILFLLVPLYTNCLTTEEYGIAELVFTIAQLITPFLTVAIHEAILRYGLMRNAKQADVLLNGVILFAFATVLSVLITPAFRLYTAVSEWRWYLCIYVISSAATTIFTSYLKVKNLNKLFAGVSIIQTAILALMNIFLLLVLHLGVKGYLIANVIAHFIAVLVVIIGGHVVDDLKRSKFDKNLFKQMIHYSSPLILNSISWWIIQSSDKIMVELMISASALGLYSVATKIPSLINVIITIFTQAWGISSIKEVESSNDTKFFSNVFSIYSFLTFGAAIVLIAIIKPFMNIYVGSQFKEAWVFVPLLLMSAIFSSISAYYGALFAALKKSLSNMTSTLIAAVANIIINFIGIKIIGIWGAVIGTVFAYILVAIIRMHGVHKELNIQIDLTKIIMNIAISLTMAILVSIDFYRVVVSIIALSLFVIINIDQIKFLADKSKRIIRRSRVRKEIDSECVDDNELQ